LPTDVRCRPWRQRAHTWKQYYAAKNDFFIIKQTNIIFLFAFTWKRKRKRKRKNYSIYIIEPFPLSQRNNICVTSPFWRASFVLWCFSYEIKVEINHKIWMKTVSSFPVFFLSFSYDAENEYIRVYLADVVVIPLCHQINHSAHDCRHELHQYTNDQMLPMLIFFRKFLEWSQRVEKKITRKS
jgi:hypothetical protein